MTTNVSVTRVICRWDDQAGVKPGWYCETIDVAGARDDSQKVWFPVDVDEFGIDDVAELVDALQGAFPGAKIIIR